jgi:PhnB protein
MYVRDSDAVFKKALAAGATVISEPQDQEYGERSGSVKDPAGITGISPRERVKTTSGRARLRSRLICTLYAPNR